MNGYWRDGNFILASTVEDRIADLERQLAEARALHHDAVENWGKDREALKALEAEIEAMRPTFEQLETISQVHTSACYCRACEIWHYYEARKPK